MTEINTFSAVVDDAIGRSGRPDRKSDIISFLRLTVRETQVLAYFENDLIEDTVAANADPFVYTQPKIFRIMRAVRYPGIIDQRGNEVYPRMIAPGKKQLSANYFWYRSGDALIFAGHNGTTGQTANIDLAYLAYLNALQYYDLLPTNKRPATYSLETSTWTYLTATTDEEKAAAELLVTHWLLFNWYDVMLEGTLAKLYKTNNDDRSVASFALYKQLQKTILSGESRAAIGGEI